MKRLQICCAVIVLFVSNAFCYGLSFYIFDANTNQEISEATIHIVGNGLNLSVVYTAGETDNFDFAGGTYTFTFSAPGHKDSSVIATLSGFKSFSIGLKIVASIEFHTSPDTHTPIEVHYDKNSSILRITGNHLGYGNTAIILYTPRGRKIFSTNRLADGTEPINIRISAPSLTQGVYYLKIDNAAKRTMKTLSVK